MLAPWQKSYENLGSILKCRDITLPTKVHVVKARIFPVVMYGLRKLDYKENWVLKNWCFWTVLLEKTLESPLDCREIQPVYPKGNQSWIFFGRTDVEVETPILWPPDGKNWLTGKDPDAGKDWRWEEKRNDRRWEVWVASPTQWTWVWANFGSWWWTGRPGMLQSMESQRDGHDWLTELNWTELINLLSMLLRCNGFTRIQKVVVYQTSSRISNSDQDLLGASLALGSALELLLSPTTELVIGGCHTRSTFCHVSQSDREMICHCCVE